MLSKIIDIYFLLNVINLDIFNLCIINEIKDNKDIITTGYIYLYKGIGVNKQSITTVATAEKAMEKLNNKKSSLKSDLNIQIKPVIKNNTIDKITK